MDVINDKKKRGAPKGQKTGLNKKIQQGIVEIPIEKLQEIELKPKIIRKLLPPKPRSEKQLEAINRLVEKNKIRREELKKQKEEMEKARIAEEEEANKVVVPKFIKIKVKQSKPRVKKEKDPEISSVSSIETDEEDEVLEELKESIRKPKYIDDNDDDEDDENIDNDTISDVNFIDTDKLKTDKKIKKISKRVNRIVDKINTIEKINTGTFQLKPEVKPQLKPEPEPVKTKQQYYDELLNKKMTKK